MKKVFITMLLAIVGFASASAQFEANKFYVGSTLNGLNLSYSDTKNLSLGFGAQGGYMFEQDWLAIGEVGFDFQHKDVMNVYVGGKCRYFIEQNGIFLQAGAKFIHSYKSYNDVVITPEVGYCFFLNKHLTVEPSVYVDLSLGDFAKRTEFGIKLGLGWYFE